MTIPASLVGTAYLGSYFCPEWELRVAARCLTEDLNAKHDVDFSDLINVEIVKTFVKDRYDRVTDTRQVAPLSCGREIWVLARGNDHRGATVFDEELLIDWLLAYGRHRSGEPNDFFPFCRQLDDDGVLLPTDSDYERALRDRDSRFTAAIRIEAPMILRDAERKPGEHRVVLGGKFGARVSVEVAEDIGRIVVAFKADSVEFDYITLILQAFHPSENWELTQSLPSRPIDPDEFAYECLYEVESESAVQVE